MAPDLSVPVLFAPWWIDQLRKASGPQAPFLFPVIEMRQDVQTLRRLLAAVVEAMGYELVGVEFHARYANALLRIYIDSENGITLDDCQRVSHQVSGVLDVEDPIAGQYTLEVSSPGLERPLFGAAQFARFVGETAKVTLKLPQDGRRRLQGEVLRVDGSTIAFAVDNAEVEIDAANIDKAKLVPDWVALGLAPAMDKSGRDARPGKQKKAAGKQPAPAKNSKNPINKPAASKPSDAE